MSYYAVLLIVCTISMYSCNDKTNEPDPSLIYGSWTRTYTGTETYHAQLNLKESGIFEWILIDTISTHTNSYAKIEVNGDQLRIYDDPDFTEEGTYQWSVSGGILSFTVVNDSYAARVSALTGNWNEKTPATPEIIIGGWQKTVVEQGTSYRVKLTMNTDGVLKWEMIDPIPGHSNSNVSFVATDNTIIIYNDPDCDGNGYFSYAVNGTDLTCTYLKDKCPPRSQSFSGTWSKIGK